VDRPDVAGLQHLADELDHRRVLVVVRWEKHALGLLRMVEHRARVGGRRGDRLLAEHVQTVLERRMCDRCVIARGRRDIDEIEVPRLGREQRLGIGIDARARQDRARLITTRSAHVGDRNDLELIRRGKIRRYVALLGDESKPDKSTL
jgi:hypothetical protein